MTKTILEKSILMHDFLEYSSFKIGQKYHTMSNYSIELPPWHTVTKSHHLHLNLRLRYQGLLCLLLCSFSPLMVSAWKVQPLKSHEKSFFSVLILSPSSTWLCFILAVRVYPDDPSVGDGSCIVSLLLKDLFLKVLRL